jgi:hypothetical protein
MHTNCSTCDQEYLDELEERNYQLTHLLQKEQMRVADLLHEREQLRRQLEEVQKNQRETPYIAAHSHGMGQEEALQRTAKWLESLRSEYGYEVLEIADRIRSGQWASELPKEENDGLATDDENQICGICVKNYDKCDCAKTGRR